MSDCAKKDKEIKGLKNQIATLGQDVQSISLVIFL